MSSSRSSDHCKEQFYLKLITLQLRTLPYVGPPYNVFIVENWHAAGHLVGQIKAKLTIATLLNSASALQY